MCRHAVSGHTNGECTTELETVPVPLKEMSPVNVFILQLVLIAFAVGHYFGLAGIIQQGLEENTAKGSMVDMSEQPS
jgi:hypothetical protein